MKLSNKVLCVVIPTVAVAMLISATANFMTIYSHQKESTEQTQLAISKKTTEQVSQGLDNLTEELQWIAQRPEVQSMDWNIMESYMASRAQRSADKFSMLMVITEAGDYYVAGKGHIEGKNLSDRVYFNKVMHEGAASFMTSPDLSKSTGEMKYTVAVPISNELGDVVGAVAANVSLNTLSNLVASDSIADGFVWAMDEYTTVIGAADRSLLMNYSLASIADDCEGVGAMADIVRAKQEGAGYITLPDGAKYFATCTPIAGTPGWSLLMAQSTNQLLSVARATLWQSITMLAIMLVVVSILVLFSLRRWLSHPLEKLSDIITKVSDGNLDVHFDNTTNSKDEIAQMAASVETMCDRLSYIVSDIKTSSDILTASSQQVSDLSQGLSTGASSQAENIEALTATTSQMTSDIQLNSDNTRKADNAFAHSYGRFADLAESLKPLFNINNDIARQTNLVNEIARQINILAINAAVEAARAGSTGKGFAVVAKEVQKLASLSSQAAEKISQLTTDGLSLNNNARQVFSEAMPSMDQTNTLITNIARASSLQTVSSEQISSALYELDAFLRANAENAKALAVNSEQLDLQAKKLYDAVAFFNVREQNVA